MKVLVLIGGGRSGIDLFQSLLDGHPQIMQFPHHFHFNEFWKKVKHFKEPSKILSIFISDNKKCFDSRINKVERHDQLGENKNEHYSVDENTFKLHFLKVFNRLEFNSYNLLYSLHAAYSLSLHEDINKKKLIVLHLHHISKLFDLEKIDFEILYTIRDPLSSISSFINHWGSFEGGKNLVPYSYFFYINRTFNGLKSCLNSKFKTHVIKFEDLHQRNEAVMRSFCKEFDLKFFPLLTKSTFMGLKWWGDVYSKKFLNGINKNYKSNYDPEIFHERDIALIEFYLRDFINHYRYPVRATQKNSIINKFLLLKSELLVLKSLIKNSLIKHIFYYFIYLIKRMIILNKNNFKNLKLPNNLGKDT